MKNENKPDETESLPWGIVASKKTTLNFLEPETGEKMTQFIHRVSFEESYALELTTYQEDGKGEIHLSESVHVTLIPTIGLAESLELINEDNFEKEVDLEDFSKMGQDKKCWGVPEPVRNALIMNQ